MFLAGKVPCDPSLLDDPEVRLLAEEYLDEAVWLHVSGASPLLMLCLSKSHIGSILEHGSLVQPLVQRGAHGACL